MDITWRFLTPERGWRGAEDLVRSRGTEKPSEAKFQ